MRSDKSLGTQVRLRGLNSALVLLSILGHVFLGLSLLAFQLGCGGNGKEDEVFSSPAGWNEIWERSEEAGRQISSFSMEISVFYQGTEFGSGLIQSSKMKVSGSDFSVETSLFGQPVSEVIQVGGNRYVKTIMDNKWKREKVTGEESVEKEELGKLSSIPEHSMSVDYMGLEELDGQPSYRLRFFLDPEKVKEVLPSVPKEQIAENKGATIDVWIRSSDFQRIRYEMTVKNTKITEKVGYGDLRVLINIRDINEQVIIKPPI